MVIEGELIRVGSFEDTDKAVWRLEQCKRGVSATEAVRHKDRALVRGLISAYGQQFLPENDSSLLAVYRARFLGHKFASGPRIFPDAFFEASQVYRPMRFLRRA